MFTVLIVSECKIERFEQDTTEGSVTAIRFRFALRIEGESG